MNTTPAEYTINVQNHSGQAHSYFLYPAAPLVNPQPSNGIYRCVQIAAPKVPSPKGSVMFSLNMKPYAITGTTSKSLAPGVKVDIKDSKRVKISTMTAMGDVVETSTDANVWKAGFGNVESKCETLGSFSIATQQHDSDSSDDPPFLGLGFPHPDHRNHVVPVACFLPQPGSTTIITPLAKWYLGYGDYEPGTVIDPETVEGPVEIDFLRCGETRAWVVHGEGGDGGWEVGYS